VTLITEEIMKIGFNKLPSKVLRAVIIAVLLLTGLSVTPALADVTVATDWYTTTPQQFGPYTILYADFNCGAGSNRLLVAVVTGEYRTNFENVITLTATKGTGVNFTPVVSTSTAAAMGVWIGYLTEAQIAGNTNDIVITGPAPLADFRGSDVHLACFSGVSQDTPIVAGGTDEGNSGLDYNFGPWDFSVNAVNGGLVLYAGALSSFVASTTHPAGYTVEIDQQGGDTPDYRTIVGSKAITATGTEAASVGTWSNSRSAFVAVSINPAVPPTITSANNTAFTVLASETFTITTSGDPAPAITLTGGSLPTGVSLVDNGDGTAALSGTAASGTVGSYPITITASNGALPDASQNFTLNVVKANQTINVTTPAPASAAYNSSFSVDATASSGLPVTYSSGSPGVCTNVGADFTMVSGTGTCVVQYDQAGDADYNAAPQVTNNVAAQKLDQTINVTTPAPANAAYNSSFSVDATASSGLPVSYSSGSPGVCTNVGALFTMVSGTGTCVVQYDQAGNADYNPAPQVTNNVSAQKLDQTINVTTPAPANAAYNSSFSVDATASSGLPVSYSSGSPGVCTNVGALFTMISGTGTCVVQYDQGGNANYNAAPQVTNNVTAQTETLTVTGITANDKVYDGTTVASINVGGAVLVGVIGGDEVTLDVTGATGAFADKDVANGKTVTISGLGLNGADAGKYSLPIPQATTTANITSATVVPSIVANDKVYDGTTDASFSCSLAGVIAPDVVSCTGGTGSFADKNVGPGKTVTATGLGLSGADSGNYQLSTTTASGSAEITVRTLTVTATGINKVYDGTTTATVSLSDDRVPGDDLTVSYASASFVDPNVGIGIIVNVTGISIDGGADIGNYTLGNTTATTTADITASGQTITVITSAPASAINGSSFDVEATASSGLPVTITTSGSCTGGDTDGTATITMTSGTGTCTVHYNQAGDSNYSAAPEVTEDVAATEGPAFTSADNTNFTVNAVGNFTITTTGNPTPAISHTSGALPTGVSFLDNSDGTATLSGAPAPGTAGVYTLQLEALNGILPNASQTFTLTVAGGPVIVSDGIGSVADTGDGHLDEFEVTTVAVTQLLVTFSEDVLNVPSTDANYGDSVINPDNYILVRDNGDGIQTAICEGGVIGGDIVITIDSVAYDGSDPFVATLNINGGVRLPVGWYRLLVCGSRSIVSATTGLPLAGSNGIEGTDFARNFRISAQNRDTETTSLPATGFPQGRVTALPVQTAINAYGSSDMLLEIPVLAQRMPIVVVPQSAGSWDVTWLGNDAGYLAGSAFPTWAGNTVITGHVWDANNLPGPFVNLKTLKYGDQVKIIAWGQVYTYEVRENKIVSPGDVATVMRHEVLDWVTLLSCEEYDPNSGDYHSRRIVRAVLVSIK